MGFLTTVVLHNDAMGTFKDDPKAFGEAILKGIHEANLNHRETSVGIGCYANYISVHPSRHADDHTLYLHYGNTVADLNCREFREFAARNPHTATGFLRVAKTILKWVERGSKKDLLALLDREK